MVPCAAAAGGCCEEAAAPASWLPAYVRYVWGLGPEPCSVSAGLRAGMERLCDPGPHLPGGTVVMEASLATTACRLPLQACLAALPAGLQAWVWDVRARRPLDPVVWRSAFAADPDLEFLMYLPGCGPCGDAHCVAGGC